MLAASTSCSECISPVDKQPTINDKQTTTDCKQPAPNDKQPNVEESVVTPLPAQQSKAEITELFCVLASTPADAPNSNEVLFTNNKQPDSDTLSHTNVKHEVLTHEIVDGIIKVVETGVVESLDQHPDSQGENQKTDAMIAKELQVPNAKLEPEVQKHLVEQEIDGVIEIVETEVAFSTSGLEKTELISDIVKSEESEQHMAVQGEEFGELIADKTLPQTENQFSAYNLLVTPVVAEENSSVNPNASLSPPEALEDNTLESSHSRTKSACRGRPKKKTNVAALKQSIGIYEFDDVEDNSAPVAILSRPKLSTSRSRSDSNASSCSSRSRVHSSPNIELSSSFTNAIENLKRHSTESPPTVKATEATSTSDDAASPASSPRMCLLIFLNFITQIRYQ